MQKCLWQTVLCWHLAALESSSTVSVATCNMVSSVPSHLHALCSTCFSAPSRGVSLWRLWLCSWCFLEVPVRLNCLCGACNTCTTLGGLLSCVLVVSFLQCFRDVRWSLPVFSWLCPLSSCLSAQWCGTCYSLWFSAPVSTLVRLLVDG